MPSCLGINIENNVIKYAKVFKERDNTRIESCGIKFYDNLDESLKQVIEETHSRNVGISINLIDEMYDNLEIFSLLDRKDLKRAVETEFEYMCSEKGYNKNILESRYTLVNNLLDKDKMKAVHVSVNKTELNKRIQKVDKYRLISMTPLPITLTNLVEKAEKADIGILNIEDKTTLTLMSRGEVQQVFVFEESVFEIFEKINKKENSYTKVYDIFKNTTLYTSSSQDLKIEENDYLDEIMPTLYAIITNVKNAISSSAFNLTKLYITGTGTAINNLDLYIQDNLSNIKCEILKPYFVRTTSNTNIKDYIEANSAIALALQGIGEGIKELNFKTLKLGEKMPSLFGEKEKKTGSKESKFKIDLNLRGKFDNIEKMTLRSIGTVTMLIIVYIVISILLGNQITSKKQQIEESMEYTQSQIALLELDTQKINDKTNRYNEFVKNLDSISEQIANRYKNKNAIPNLLFKMMNVIPETVQITSVKNTTGKHIVINAQAEKYEQLGYFKAKLKADNILLNVESDSGIKQDSIVKVTIEGDLP